MCDLYRVVRLCAALGFGVALIVSTPSHSAEPIHVYGPGGPAPAMKAAAVEFAKKTGIEVDVTAGPTPQWADAAHANADLIYSGSEDMMSGFVAKFGDELDANSAEPLYLRPAVILVRPGNPHHIRGIVDLWRGDAHVMVVDGSGQNGLWEDLVGRDGDIRQVRALRRNIVAFAPNTAEALKRWNSDPSVDAWIVYNIWAVAHPGIADIVPVESRYRLYRDCGVVLTQRGTGNADAHRFVEFLESPEGLRIFRQYGWTDRSQGPQ
ncbi:ABC transporter substrate-binding protein [Trinickia violacea]|uniref:ABC transporter substrate-binding protein n=2 Tax=Trinickia violacea TaxID=2571746 RepID=A0A4P8J3A2_9BURK|nr:ABC transporter substrate-binding protein [Trinickia violacea]